MTCDQPDCQIWYATCDMQNNFVKWLYTTSYHVNIELDYRFLVTNWLWSPVRTEKKDQKKTLPKVLVCDILAKFVNTSA